MVRWTLAATAVVGLIALAACQKPAPVADTADASSSASPEPEPASASAEASSVAPSGWSGADAPPLPKHITPVPQAFLGRWGAEPQGCSDSLEIATTSLSEGEDETGVRSTTIVSPTHIRIVGDLYGEATSDLPAGASTYAGTVTYDLTLLDGGKTLKQVMKDGTVITYARCPAAAEATDATDASE